MDKERGIFMRMNLLAETGRCLLCLDPACTAACPQGIDAGRILRALQFSNHGGANRLLGDKRCQECGAPCEAACRRGQLDYPVHIKDVLLTLAGKEREEERKQAGSRKNILALDFMGVSCENPFFLSSSVVGSSYEMVARAFRLGWAGVSYKTISKIDIREASPRYAALMKDGTPFVGFKNIEQLSDCPYEENLAILRRLKQELPSKGIVASIMGRNVEEWEQMAADMEQAGADIIECNFSCPQMVGEKLGAEIGENPDFVAMYTAAVRRGTRLPVLAKMTPNITHMEVPARAAIRSGADGIAAINTIKSIMNINLDSYVSEPDVQGKCAEGGYSGKAVKPIALRFINDLKQDKELGAIPISGMGGIENWRDAAEFLALGCGNLQVTTAVMQYGYRIIEDLTEGLAGYIDQMGMASVSELIGRALPHIVRPEALNRETIEYPKFQRSLCISCGRCVISCQDGGHQALHLDGKGLPVLDPKRCVGCHLCRLICPADAVSAGKRVAKG